MALGRAEGRGRQRHARMHDAPPGPEAQVGRRLRESPMLYGRFTRGRELASRRSCARERCSACARWMSRRHGDARHRRGGASASRRHACAAPPGWPSSRDRAAPPGTVRPGGRPSLGRCRWWDHSACGSWRWRSSRTPDVRGEVSGGRLGRGAGGVNRRLLAVGNWLLANHQRPSTNRHQRIRSR
jgi:hypothetical protein